MFLEIWKRQRARVVLHWDLYGWDEDQVRCCQGTPQGLLPPSAPCLALCPCPGHVSMSGLYVCVRAMYSCLGCVSMSGLVSMSEVCPVPSPGGSGTRAHQLP